MLRDMGVSSISDTSVVGLSSMYLERSCRGYTVLVEEVLQQLAGEALTHVFVQGGVGGLAAAVLWPFLQTRLEERSPSVIVVEPEGAACLFASAQAGRPTSAPASGLAPIMAGLDCGEVSLLAWDILKDRTARLHHRSGRRRGSMHAVACFFHRQARVRSWPANLLWQALRLYCWFSQSSALRDALGLSVESRALVIGTEGDTDPKTLSIKSSGLPPGRNTFQTLLTRTEASSAVCGLPSP